MIRATPFHARTAELNRANRWTTRDGITLAAAYDDADHEAAAARFGVIVADISWRWRLTMEGARVREMVQRLFTRDAAPLLPGQALKALWLSDGGGVRGAGVISRHGRQAFQLTAATTDAAWFEDAAQLFGVTLHDLTGQEGGLALIGPYAAKLLATLGIDPALEPLHFHQQEWRGFPLTLARFGEHNGYEIWCEAEHALYLWDRIAAAGAHFALVPAGVEAVDTLDLEAGVPRPGRDYDGAHDPHAAGPLPGELRLGTLVEAEQGFNGRAAALTAQPKRRLAGIVLDSDVSAPFASLLRDGQVVGRALSSRYSPVLRRAIALAQIDLAHASAGTRLSLMLPPSRDVFLPTVAAATVVDLPFLPAPDAVGP
ncbi:MAG: aminomethyl transferase family protein [Alphaproteobacteria bacterium]|nr:aminomethyl transferase family protein [Alphaproteobacteria bacterium]MBL6937197.1 aminomethyl transferase family protein [Alphaproteobacteria bacterium]MBL7096241.1 aminomethyl transferase family protein [Alphaproteobacteria bacterium]